MGFVQSPRLSFDTSHSDQVWGFQLLGQGAEELLGGTQSHFRDTQGTLQGPASQLRHRTIGKGIIITVMLLMSALETPEDVWV